MDHRQTSRAKPRVTPMTERPTARRSLARRVSGGLRDTSVVIAHERELYTLDGAQGRRAQAAGVAATVL